MVFLFSFKALSQKHATRTAKPAACLRAIHNHSGGCRGRGGLCPWCQTQGSRGVARPFYRPPGFRRADPKIPGRQGLARGEPRCCLCPAAVIMAPNLESSGRAACSAAIRRLFNCGALVYCFPLRGCSCQQPARHQHCKPRHRGSSAGVPEH